MDRMDPEGRIFIPECIGEGRYRAEQCHNSTGYCWCVDSQTGKPIPGTSTHNVVPDCSNIRSSEFKGALPEPSSSTSSQLQVKSFDFLGHVSHPAPK